MDAVEFLKAKNRICREYGILVNDCYGCPLGNDVGGCQAGVMENQKVTEEELVQIVEKWSAEHPVKTRQSEFLKMFPNAELDKLGSIDICPTLVDKNMGCLEKVGGKCMNCRKEYWLAEVQDK